MSFAKISFNVANDEFTLRELKELHRSAQELDVLIIKKITEYSARSIHNWLGTNPSIRGEEVGKVYNQYLNWCIENDELPENKIMFSKKIITRMGVKSHICNRKGVSKRVYL